MNGGESQRATTGVRESVWDPGRTDDDMTARHHGLPVTKLERGLAGLDEEHLDVRVAVELRATSRWRVHHRSTSVSILNLQLGSASQACMRFTARTAFGTWVVTRGSGE
jgi:hypothetical protein